MGQAVPLSLLLAASTALLMPVARAGGGRDVESVFFVAKSENRNQVHYGVHLNADCAPVGDAPVFAYWRMFEHGPSAVEPLLARETRAYGFLAERVLTRDVHGGRIVITLAALATRPIVVDTYASGEACIATAKAAIGGEPATLRSVFVQLRWPFGLESLTLSGLAGKDGRAVRERITP